MHGPSPAEQGRGGRNAAVEQPPTHAAAPKLGETMRILFRLEAPNGGTLLAAALARELPVLCVWVGSRCFSFRLPDPPPSFTGAGKWAW